MPLRGENIGTAYVRILADGSGLDESVRDQMDDLDWESMGRKGSKEFTEGFEKEQEKAPNQSRLRDAIAGPLLRAEWLTEEFFRSKNWTNFRSGLEREFGDAGKRAGETLETKLYEGMNFDQLDRHLKNMTPIIVNAQKQIDKELLAEQRKREQEEADLRAQGLADEKRTNQERVEDNRRTARQKLADDIAAERLRRRGIALTKAAYEDLNALVERMARGEEEKQHNRDVLKEQLRNLRLEMDRLEISTHKTNDRFRDNNERLYRMHPRITKITNDMDRLGVTVGRAFGKGSRNDFVNFMGVVASGVTRLALTAIPRAIGGITSYLGKLKMIGDEGGSVIGQLAKDTSKVIGGLGAGVGGLFLIIGPLVSIFSQLLGAAMALVSTISFGLVGAVGALSGALLPLGAGIAATILGFKNLEGDAKKAAKGVLNAFKGLGKDAAEGLTFDRDTLDENHHHVILSFEEMMERIQNKVEMLGPIMNRAGRGVADALNIALTKGPLKKGGAWDQFIKAMRGGDKELGWLGVQTRKLGRIFSESFGGILGLFRGLMPSTSEFLSWARDLSVEFSKWANSPQGLRDIHTFMDRATDSAKELGGFLGAVWDVFRTLTDAGQGAGDTLFSSMTATLEEWNRNLQADGGAGLREWFSDSARFAQKLGDAMVDLLDLFKDLDTQTSREIATVAFESLARVLRTIEAVLGPVVRLFDGLNKATNGAAGAVAAAALVFPRMNAPIQNMKNNMGTMVTNMRNAETRMASMKSAAQGLAGAAGLALLVDGMNRTRSATKVMETTLGGAAAGFAVGGPIGAGIGALAGLWLGLGRNVRRSTEDARKYIETMRNFDAVDAAKESLQDLKSTLDQVTGAYTGATRAAVLHKLEEAGMVDVANQFGVSTRSLINAAMGQKGAMEDLTPAIGKVEAKIRDLHEQQREITLNRENWTDTGLSRAATEQVAKLEDQKAALKENIEVLRQMPGQLRKMGRETRESAAATADYSGMLHGIPENIRTKIEADGIIPSVKGVAKVADKYDLVDRKEIKTLIKASGADATVKEVLKVINKNKELDRQKPKPQLDADPSNANEVIRNVENVLGILDRSVFRPKIDVDSNAQTAAQSAAQWLRSIDNETVYIDVQRRGGRAPVLATGGLINGATMALVGEAGPEAVVPLNRPLGMVDPSVRWLSAIAQGKEIPRMARGGVAGNGKTVNVGGITVLSPSSDPAAVAQQTINRLVASAY
jgi:hypothetical protein